MDHKKIKENNDEIGRINNDIDTLRKEFREISKKVLILSEKKYKIIEENDEIIIAEQRKNNKFDISYLLNCGPAGKRSNIKKRYLEEFLSKYDCNDSGLYNHKINQFIINIRMKKNNSDDIKKIKNLIEETRQHISQYEDNLVVYGIDEYTYGSGGIYNLKVNKDKDEAQVIYMYYGSESIVYEANIDKCLKYISKNHYFTEG